MTQQKTCKNCEHWDKPHPNSFVRQCQCPTSPKHTWVTWDNQTCDKHESNDRQSEMELK